MSTIKSYHENLVFNADGAGSDIIFQSNASQVGSISDAGVITATSFSGSGASLTNIPASALSGSPTYTTVNATTVDLGNWTVTESAGVLYFATSGTNKMKLDASGNLSVAGDITAYDTI